MATQHFEGQVDPIMVAAIVVMESSGVTNHRMFREDFQETAHGLGQMLLSTAEFLVEAGYSVYHPEHPEDLNDPSVAIYFVCAYVDYLSKLETIGKCEEFVIKGYHNGSIRMEEASDEVWDVYLKARSQLLRLKSAMHSSEPDQIIHVVQPGEDLESIGRICGVSAEAIMKANPDIKEMDCIQSGDCIEIPVDRLLPRLYAVKTGDKLTTIARRHDISLFRLLNANADIKNPSIVKPGWVLSIPGLRGTSAERGVRNGLIACGIEDGPFFRPSFTECYALGVDQDIIPRAPTRGGSLRRRSHGRATVCKLLGSHKPQPNAK